ncbi:unnamed protein product [Caenorhabditis bovis]|uniref:SSD domain-containing protein n=1 Tax=Caenorhabditis bovis TaxID=2654633 RepID=A0A8S1EA20_9PELO|nr:unnamed protein product [Caenorhabditis bovis]
MATRMRFLVFATFCLLASGTAIREKRNCGCSTTPSCSCQQDTNAQYHCSCETKPQQQCCVCVPKCQEQCQQQCLAQKQPKSQCILLCFEHFSVILTTYAIYFHRGVIDFDPTKGFETRGTPLSSARLTLEALKSKQIKNEKVLRWYYQEKRTKREVSPSTTTLEPITVDYDDYGVNPEPNSSDLKDHCEMFGSLGQSIPYDALEYLSKVMIKVESWEKLFTVPVLKHLCNIDDILDSTMNETKFKNAASTLQHSFNIPRYTTCVNMSTPNRCDSINQNDVSYFRSLLDSCRRNSLDPRCQAFSIDQAINLLFQRSNDTEDTVITVIFKVQVWTGEQRDFYDKLLVNLGNYIEENENLQLVGVNFNLKEQIFVEQINKEALIAGISAFFVFLWFFAYSKSIVFTLLIFLVVALSAGVAFFIYTCILGVDFFPFINLLVMVLLIAIGADDAFLLLVYFRREVKKMSNLEYKIGAAYVPLYREQDLLARSLRISLHHSLSSMFVTSLTTAATFLTNLTSPVIVLRCFGIYACTTIIVNYVLVVLVLPGAIILTKPVSTKSRKICTDEPDAKDEKRATECGIAARIAHATKTARFGIIALTILLTSVSVFLIFETPGMRVPETNPTKLLVDSNYHEFFDNHVHRFNFEWKRSARIIKYFIFGINPVKDNSSLSPYHKPLLHKPPAFGINEKKLEFYQELIRSETSRYFYGNISFPSWAELTRKLNESCIGKNVISSECSMRISVKYNQLIHEFPEDFSVIPGDGPFINEDLETIGYFISIPTDEKLRIDAKANAKIFNELDESCSRIRKSIHDPVICLSSTEITRFHDIIQQLRSSSLMSVIISMTVCLVVIVACTRVVKLSIFSSFIILSIIGWTTSILILLGWQLSVVESTILVITIGLSFDYTLHYAVAIRDVKRVPTVEKISIAHSTAGVACAFGAATLISAGIPLLFCQTASFFQIGSMLIVLGVTSFIGAAFVFPAYILAFSFSFRERTKL